MLSDFSMLFGILLASKARCDVPGVRVAAVPDPSAGGSVVGVADVVWPRAIRA